jgi:hypothetical protein
MTKEHLEELNLNRATAIVRTCMSMEAFPVLVCALTEREELIVFGFTGQAREDLKEMLTAYLASVDDGNLIVPGES